MVSFTAKGSTENTVNITMSIIKQLRLSELILEKIYLRALPTGWYTCKCQICNDHKERSSFKFDSDNVIYSCFNCSTTGVYEEFSEKISYSMRKILHAYGIEDSEINLVVNSTFFFKKEEKQTLSLKALTKVNTYTPPTSLPAQTFKLGETNEHIETQGKIVQYLVNRCIDLDKFIFFFSILPRFKNRVIIPFYRDGKLIYWQARSIDHAEKKRYDNCVAGRDAVIFNMDQLNSFSPVPLFVSEGVFDAMMLGGIAVLGSKLTNAKLELMNNSRRRLVFPIDKDKNGQHFAESVLAAGWEITFVPDGAGDLNRSVQRFGRSWTAQQLIKNIPKDPDIARLAIKMNCRS